MDIEDAYSPSVPVRSQPSNGIVKARFRNKKSPLDVTPSMFESLDCVPDVHKVFVQTWGCTHNTSDSEYMAGLLAKYGYQVTLGGSQRVDLTNPLSESTSDSCACGEKRQPCCTDTPSRVSTDDDTAKQEATVWLLNSCTVKGPAEDHFRNAVLSGLKLGKRLVVAGCVPQGRPDADYLKGVSVIGVQQIDRVVEVVEETLRGNTVRFLEKKLASTESHSRPQRLAGASLDLPKIRRNPLIEILAVSTGCLNACTYCKTKHARGVLTSYPIDQLLDRAKQAFAEGVKELWLTSEDLGAYGRDLSRNTSPFSCPSLSNRFPDCLTLADLLAGLVPLIPAGCMLRLGMTNPPYILDQLREICDVLSHPRVYAFIHIPVQSGSDAVLDRMQREYTAEEFCEVVNFLRDHVKAPSRNPVPTNSTIPTGCGSLTVATDIICGFPNETEADFEETVQLVERFKFPVLYINQFFARPGTPAASMPRKATTAEVKKRTKRLHELFRTYSPYTNREGAEVRVLVTEVSTDGRYWVGHTKAYEQVLVPRVPDVYGRIVLVRIVECDKFFMRADLVDHGPFDSLDCSDLSQSQLTLPSWAVLDSRLPCASSQQAPIIRPFDSTKQTNSKWILHLALLLLLSYVLLKVLQSHELLGRRPVF